MSAIDPLLRFPSRERGDEFQADCDYFFGEFNRIFDQMNAVAASFISSALSGTSTSSVAVATSVNKTFATQSGKSWLPGQFLVASSVLSPGVFMVGQVVSYSSASGTLVLHVQRAVGVGTFSAWNITLAAPANALSAADLLAGVVPEDRLAGGNYRAINLLRANQVSASQFVINSQAPELVLSETGQTSPAGLWRVLLDSNAYRVHKATSDGDFATFQEFLRIDPNGRINGDGSGLTGVSASYSAVAGSLLPAGGFTAKAMVLFNGKGTSSDIRLRAENVSSITDEGVGTYLVNLATPLPTASGIVNITAGDTVGRHISGSGHMISASQCRVYTFANDASSSLADWDRVSVVIF